MGMLTKVYRQYQGPTSVPESGRPVLDFEYKKVVPGNLLLKQVREVGRPLSDVTTRYLLNEPAVYWVYQSETSDPLANHRLKCLLRLETRSLRLDLTNLQECFYPQAEFQFRTGTNLQTVSGPVGNWPGAAHTVSVDPARGTIVRDRWTFGSEAAQRQFELTSIIPPPAAEGIFVRTAELRKWLKVTYTTPMPVPGRDAGSTSTGEEEVQLVQAPDLTGLRPGEPETFSAGIVTFSVQFLNPASSTGPPLGVDKNFWGTYPAALSPWMQTRVTGLTSEPIELHGYWSQSARAGHKFRYAWYVFEPKLEPGLSARILEELRTADIQLIYIEREAWPGGQTTARVLGSDGVFRSVF
jgi:hypothetical protein